MPAPYTNATASPAVSEADRQSLAGAADAPQHHTNPVLIYGLLVLMMAIWTLNYLVAKEGYKQIDGLTMGALRVECAALLMVPIFFVRRRQIHRPRRYGSG